MAVSSYGLGLRNTVIIYVAFLLINIKSETFIGFKNTATDLKGLPQYFGYAAEFSQTSFVYSNAQSVLIDDFLIPFI